MAYNSNIPQAGDKISNSQSDILGNFLALAPFGNGYAEFTLQGSVPSFGISSTGMYTLLYAQTAKNELYIHKESIDAPTDVPFTASKMSNTAIASCVNGWSYLPSGLLIKWGSYSVTSSGVDVDVDVAVTSGGPNFNKVFQVFITPVNDSISAPDVFTANVSVPADDTTGDFSVKGAQANAFTYISYMVIGV